jgi:large subunit ribosomal protein L21
MPVMNYAVLQSGGKQYKVTNGSVIEVEKLAVAAGDTVKLDKVLLVADDGAYQVGTPLVANAIVTAKVLEQKQGPKIRVAKFKAKARYRKVIGHRQQLTKLEIVEISGKAKAEAKKAKEE